MRKLVVYKEIETQNLRLRKLTIDDLDTLHDYYSNKENFEFAYMNEHISINETRSFIERMSGGMDSGKWAIYGIELKESNELIGTISLWNFNKDRTEAELGYGIFPKYRRNGYMKQSMKVILPFAFKDLKLEKVFAYTSHFNNPSKSFLSDFGFEHQKTFQDDYSNGALMDVYHIKNQ